LGEKLNRLIEEWPYGAVMPQSWLDGQGISSNRAARLARSGWLVRVGQGAYARSGDPLDWPGAVFGLQQDVDGHGMPAFWPGGLTALELIQGSHFVRFREQMLTLWARPRASLPKWFLYADWGVSVEHHGYRLFDKSFPESLVSFAPPGREYALAVSAPERAVLEWLYELSEDSLFSSLVMETFAGLTTLRPRRLQPLLEQCRSVKVKRVFLFLARYHGHSWYQRLDPDSIDFGKGKRQLIPGGRLDKEFQITVPEELADVA
jgi:hypothetical protein